MLFVVKYLDFFFLKHCLIVTKFLDKMKQIRSFYYVLQPVLRNNKVLIKANRHCGRKDVSGLFGLSVTFTTLNIPLLREVQSIESNGYHKFKMEQSWLVAGTVYPFQSNCWDEVVIFSVLYSVLLVSSRE